MYKNKIIIVINIGIRIFISCFLVSSSHYKTTDMATFDVVNKYIYIIYAATV